MSQEVFLRVLFAGLFSLVFACLVFFRYDAESGLESLEGSRQKYMPYIPGNLLPAFLAAILVFGTAYYGIKQAAHMTLALCFSIFLHISVYYLVLILLLPLLRKFISARACAMLWIIPNYLYITQQSFMELPGPLFVVTASEELVWILFALWLAGFAAVLIWKIGAHLVFRRRVLKHAVLVDNPHVLSVWEKTVAEARIRKPKFKLVTSPAVKTPLSVGLSRRSTRVILPRLGYSMEDLELIFRHEIVHIGREDAWSKFFLVFCTAMCWFNPLMWLAMKKSAEDMELSCDETVLLNTGPDTRKRYAELLLDTAGDERGFTTCLSASARAMRHRLKTVVKPAKRRSGALAVGAVFFVLCMTSGYTALAYGGGSGAELIYQSEDPGQYTLRDVSTEDDEYHARYALADQEAFHAYLSGLTLYRLTGNYSFSNAETSFTYILNTPKGTLVIVLTDEAIKLVPLYGEERTSTWYYIAGGVDWDYLNTITVAYPAINVYLTREGEPYGNDLSAHLSRLWRTEEGQRTLVYESGLSEGETHGVFGHTLYDEAAFSFSKEFASPCSVFIETWDRGEGHTVTQPDMTQPFALALPEYPAHYTVFANYYDRTGALCEAEFCFDLGYVN